MRKLFLFLLVALLSNTLFAAALEKEELNGHSVQVVHWAGAKDSSEIFILLSGPIDTWHSDAAWFAGFGNLLSAHGDVYAIDRATMGTENSDAPLGYVPLADDLHAFIQSLTSEKDVPNVNVLAFASSNITMAAYFDKYGKDSPVKNVVMIDPDVLTPFSIARYKSDTQGFVDNLDKYIEYIGEGKYIDRVKQKNEHDRKTVKALVKDRKDMEWPLLDIIFCQRLKIVQQQNLFKEIAIYGQELDSVKDVVFPKNVRLRVFDTDFEQAYIDGTEDKDAIDGLSKWRDDGAKYYQSLAEQSADGKVITVKSEAHLYHLDNPEVVIKALTGE